MTIKLHGFPLSNYYNMVKMTLLEKGLDFEEVYVRPSQEAGFLAMSPMGKVPLLETDQGFLTEAGVIIEYLEDRGDGPSFFPADAWGRAKVRELMRYLELYIELPARRLYGDVFFDRPATDTEKGEVRKLLEKGFASLERLGRYDPWLAGSDISYADFYFMFSMSLATRVTRTALNWDTYNSKTGVRDLLERLSTRESVRRIRADQEAPVGRIES